MAIISPSPLSPIPLLSPSISISVATSFTPSFLRSAFLCRRIRYFLRLRRRFGDPLVTPLRWAVVAAAVAGAAFGSKILFWLEDPQLTWHNLHNPAFFVGGKTIVGALAFGLLTVELIKRYIGLRQSTGDLYAIPLALGIAIGRIGCFLTGLSDNTYGIPSDLPWPLTSATASRATPPNSTKSSSSSH